MAGVFCETITTTGDTESRRGFDKDEDLQGFYVHVDGLS